MVLILYLLNQYYFLLVFQTLVVENVVKLSTKNPDLNLFNPFSSGTNKLAVAVSKRVNEL